MNVADASAELNNQAYWNWEKACELVDYAVAHAFNTVIVGQVICSTNWFPKGYTPHHYNDRLSSQQRAAACISTAWGCCASRKDCVFTFRRKSSTSRPICCWRTRICLSGPGCAL
jgi:hypothetical protein